MRVRRNTKDGEWMFGRGLADYAKDEEAILQNLKTRILSFQNDWFLDTSAEIDWFDLLGRKGTQEEIKREIERVAIATEGIVRVDKIELIKFNRSATIKIDVTTIFNRQLSLDLGIEQ
jgi:hypothetical protein